MQLPDGFAIYVDATADSKKKIIAVGYCIKLTSSATSVRYYDTKIYEYLETSSSEMKAVLFALEFIKDRMEKGEINVKIRFTVHSDNESVIAVINSGKLLNNNMDSDICKDLFGIIFLLKDKFNCSISFKWIARRYNKVADNLVSVAKNHYLAKSVQNEIDEIDSVNGDIDDGNDFIKKYNLIGDICKTAQFYKLLKKTLDKIANIRFDIMRVDFVIESFKNKNQEVVLTLEERNNIVLLMDLRIIFYYNQDTYLKKHNVDFIKNMSTIICDYNNKLKKIKQDLMEVKNAVMAKDEED